jgi:hypothetical protein
VKRFRRNLFLAIGLIVVLVVGYPVFMHFQFRWSLAAYRKELRARGEKLTIRELAPRAPTNGPNGALALWSAATRLAPLNNPSQLPASLTLVAPGRARVEWAQEELSLPDSTNAWPRLSEQIEGARGVFAEVRAALDQPALQFNLDYFQGVSLPLPHLAPLKKTALMLSAAVMLDLHEGRFREAVENLRTAQKLAARYVSEPLIVSQMVRLTIVRIAVGANWEALQAPGWTDEQLAELQAAWASLDLLSPTEPALAMDRAVMAQMIHDCRDSYQGYSTLRGMFQPGRSAPGLQSVVRDTPLGYTGWKLLWSYDAELGELEISQSSLETARLLRANHCFVPALKRSDAEAARIRRRHPDMEAWLGGGFPETDWRRSLLPKVAAAEMQRQLLITALALKRSQIRHGRVPAGLDALVPEFLAAAPLDPMDGKPLRYRTNADGTFLLYSVGEDGVDNGGDASLALLSPPTETNAWWHARDAVWPLPATAEQVAAYEAKMPRRHAVSVRAGRKDPMPVAATATTTTNAAQSPATNRGDIKTP